MAAEVELRRPEVVEGGIKCPYCGAVVDHFIYKPSKRGWAYCPNCERSVRRQYVPEEYLKVVEEKEEEEGREGEGVSPIPPYEPIKTPIEILREVLEQSKRWGLRGEAIEFIVSEAETTGFMQPTDLHNLLNELSRKFTGIQDPRIIPHIVRRYATALMREQERAKSIGETWYWPTIQWPEVGRPAALSYPTGYTGRPPERYHYPTTTGYTPPPRYSPPTITTPEYTRYEPSRYYQPPSYQPPSYQPPRGRPLTYEDLERFFEERERRREEEELRRKVYSDIPRMVDEKFGALQREIAEIKHMLESGAGTGTLTQEDIERILERERELHQKELERLQLQLRSEYDKELSERERKFLSERIEQLEKEIERLREESRTGRRPEDIAYEVVKVGERVLETRPVRDMVRMVVGARRIEGKPPELEETKSEVGFEEYIPPEFVEEE